MPLPAVLDGFMDDLSEDWVSQPRLSSSTPSSPSSQLRSSKRKSVLSERSQNHSNIQANSVQRNGLSRRSLSDASSTGSAAGRFDTTARKSVSVSPPKSRKLENEPEWRRKLLQGQMDARQDLFSPMAIENIFQKPASRGSFRRVDLEKDKPRGLSFLKSFEQQLPSSPPPWPPVGALRSQAPSRYGTVNTRQLSQLDEEEEDSRVSMRESETDDSFVAQNPTTSVKPHQTGTRVASNGSVVQTGTVTSRKVSFGSVRLAPTSRKPSDNTSWNLTTGSDDFSPVFISKHNTADGRIAYAALDLSKSELEQRVQQHLHGSQQLRSRSVSHSTRHTNNTGDESSLERLASEALPEDLPVGTPDVADVASIGEFVSIKRGGYSESGSFKRRPLSPSPLKRPISTSVDESSMLPQDVASSDHSGIPLAAPTPPAASAPKTPLTDRVGDFLSPQKAKNSNSPLKLFENHDTFTANRLQRRISQLEEPEEDTLGAVRGSPSRRATGDLSALDEASHVDQQDRVWPRRKPEARRQSSIQQHFGQGDFDDYSFDEQHYSSPRGSDIEDDLPSRSVSPDVPPPGYHQPFKFHVEEPPSDFIDTFKGRRRPSRELADGQLSIAKRSDRNRPALSLLTETRVASHPSQLSQVSEGKRPLTPSPFKSPTPKRRRTIIRHEMTSDDEETKNASSHETHGSFQRALSRKRKDARYGDERNTADPDTLAHRSILRPRNPTPSQRRREEAERALREAQVEAAASSSPRLGAIKEQLGLPPLPGESVESVQVRALATHLAVIGEDVAQRKKSVTTQDFLDDAMKVMHFIRTQYRPNGNLNSLNEQDSGVQQVQSEAAELAYSSWERPPSRDGRPRSVWRTSKAEVVDARVASHLERYQEEEDDTFLTATSRASRDEAANEVMQEHIETIESDPPGIQLMGQSPAVQRRNHSRTDSNQSSRKLNSAGTDGTTGTKGSKISHSSRTSVDSTLGRTINSRKSASENVATLAPDAVAHLIPEQIAGMTYDKELGRWVRQKRASDRDRDRKSLVDERSGMTGSDHDPFGDIPDLTVDSMEETKHLLLSRSTGRRAVDVPPEEASAMFNEYASRPVTRDRADLQESIEVTELVKATLSPETTQVHLSSKKALGAMAGGFPLPPKVPQPESEQCAEDEDVEHEISILDGRTQSTPLREARNVTVQLSSPAWMRGKTGLSPVLESPGPTVSVRDWSRVPPQPIPNFQTQAASSRPLSLSVRVSGTVTTLKTDLAKIQSSSPAKGDLTFHLSELPEFTLNQIDERELPLRVLSKHNTVGHPFRGSEDRYASGNQLLVKAVQDAEPDEPYWEDLRKVDLRDNGLTSLHLLDVLCDRLEKLDVSRNMLAQLEGIPHTVRCLGVRNNMLTSLTAWGHLFNLQYLDISFNHLDSLEGLAGLVHLRELRADGNQIETLEGLGDLDGLLRLSLRNNRLSEISFEGYNLQRLESLDLGQNSLSSVECLHHLEALMDLRLDGNDLTNFLSGAEPCRNLRSLDLSKNAITDFSHGEFCPHLRHLRLDNSSLVSTSGIAELHNLESLSMRSQSVSCDLKPLLNARLPNLHTLCLSENHIPSLALPQDWFSLRTLELASCGLQELPDDFGLSAPSLRVLNLNSNAIKDLRPLLNIKALEELHVAGNRLARLRKTTAVLSKLRALQVLDLRDNAFTLGFHPPAVESRLVSTSVDVLAASEEDSNSASSWRQLRLEEEHGMKFTLPPGDAEADAQYFARVDQGTRLRRRVYEMLLANECVKLGRLDGLSFGKEKALVRDEVWDRLVELGVVRKSSN